jgi:hypothetical protein
MRRHTVFLMYSPIKIIHMQCERSTPISQLQLVVVVRNDEKNAAYHHPLSATILQNYGLVVELGWSYGRMVWYCTRAVPGSSTFRVRYHSDHTVWQHAYF